MVNAGVREKEQSSDVDAGPPTLRSVTSADRGNRTGCWATSSPAPRPRDVLLFSRIRGFAQECHASFKWKRRHSVHNNQNKLILPHVLQLGIVWTAIRVPASQCVRKMPISFTAAIAALICFNSQARSYTWCRLQQGRAVQARVPENQPDPTPHFALTMN
jgi:hypothetical protein